MNTPFGYFLLSYWILVLAYIMYSLHVAHRQKLEIKQQDEERERNRAIPHPISRVNEQIRVGAPQEESESEK